jgi:fructose-bisphosphate aldolase class II
MYDGSKLPLEENLANSRRVVEAAREAGVGVEAELGVVGSGSKYASYGARGRGLTDPAVAERFAAESGCDMLAVAVGSAHGQYNAEPRLDLERLREIRRRVEQPLSMHGGSGLSDEQFRAAIAGGICKINIGTDMRLAARDRMVEAARQEGVSYHDLSRAERRGFRERAEHFLDLFAEGAP